MLQIAAGNEGVGRLTSITDQSGSTALVYDLRGNLTQETRTIGGVAYGTAYAYDLADRFTSVTYLSGRIVSYTRDSLSWVTGVTSKENAGATAVTVASSIAFVVDEAPEIDLATVKSNEHFIDRPSSRWTPATGMKAPRSRRAKYRAPS